VIIDFHVHIWEEGTPFHQGSPDDYVKKMDLLGIDKMCILGVDQGKHDEKYNKRPSQVRLAAFEKKFGHKTTMPNKFVYDFVKVHPDRLVGFGSLHPDSDYNLVDEFERCVNDYGFKGIKLYPLSGLYPDDERMFPVYEKAEQYGSVVLFHSGVKDCSSMKLKYDDPIFIDNLASEFPELKIVIAHVGYPWVDKAIQISFCNANVFLEISGLLTFEAFTNAPIIEDTLTKIVKYAIVNEKTIFGSDGPRPTEKYLQVLKEAEYIPADDKKRILGETADWLLSSSNEQFREYLFSLPEKLFARMAPMYKK
jgi:predicted TIM-barrel fold metal-dependent hydrolase